MEPLVNDQSVHLNTLENALGFSSFGQKKKKRRRQSSILLEEGQSIAIACKNALNMDAKTLLHLFDCSMDKCVLQGELDLINADLLQQIQAAKNRFKNISLDHFRNARRLTNKYEMISRGRFINRSAMKMVFMFFPPRNILFDALELLLNLDAKFGFSKRGYERNHFLFADICGGPGGFSEYFLWRMGNDIDNFHGWGFTLRDTSCDWNMKALGKDLDLRFTQSYGADGSGNIYSLANIAYFAKQIQDSTHGEGMDLVVADGGFAEARDRLDQEEVMVQLILSEILMMYRILSKGGDFVCKMFDIHGKKTCGLVYVLYRTFESVTSFKPITSRPASSERYIICQNLQVKQPTLIIEHLEEWSKAFIEKKENFQEVFSSWMLQDDNFLEYIRESNTIIASCQLDSCCQILTYSESLSNEMKDLQDLQKNRMSERHIVKKQWQLAQAYYQKWKVDVE